MKHSKQLLTIEDVDHVAALANLHLSDAQSKDLTEQLGVTVEYVSQFQSVPTEGIAETSQVTGLENSYREDVIDTTRILTQEQALSNAKRTHEGYFVVDAVFEK